MEALFILLFLLAIMAGLIALGYCLAADRLADDRAQLDVQRQALDIEWQALENGRRVNEVFFQARQAMRGGRAGATAPAVSAAPTTASRVSVPRGGRRRITATPTPERKDR